MEYFIYFLRSSSTIVLHPDPLPGAGLSPQRTVDRFGIAGEFNMRFAGPIAGGGEDLVGTVSVGKSAKVGDHVLVFNE